MCPKSKRSRKSLKQLVLVGLLAVMVPTTGCDMAAIGKVLAALGPLLTAIGGLVKPAGAAPGATTPGATGATTPGTSGPGVATNAGRAPAGQPTITARANPFQVTDSLHPIIARSR